MSKKRTSDSRPRLWSDEEILAAHRNHIWHPYTDEGLLHGRRPPLVIRRAEGHLLYDGAGKAYFDGNGSWWSNLLGHRHPELLAALEEQLHCLDHAPLAGIAHEAAARAAEALVKSGPDCLTRVFFSDDGSTAVETALKMAVHYFRNIRDAGRCRFFCLEGGFHGETTGCVSVSSTELFQDAYGSMRFPSLRLPSPAILGLEEAWAGAERMLAEHGGSACAVILEPLVQGAGGMRMYPAMYLRRLRELTKKMGILLIVDEVFTGLGRSGRFWAVDLAGIEPDILCTSKGLAGGMIPFAATLATEEIYSAFYGGPEKTFFHGHTFTGNPIGAALARSTIELVNRELPFVQERAESFAGEMGCFRSLKAVREVRSLGLIAAVEIEGDGYTDGIGWEIYDRALEKGLYARPLGNVLYLLPALNMPDEARKKMVSILFRAASEVLG